MSTQQQNKEAQQYNAYVQAKMPKTKSLSNCLRAFWVGGLICCIGQGIKELLLLLPLTTQAAGSYTSVILVFLGTTLTGIGVYDKIGKYAGAGSIVPITGFANSVASPAIEFKQEGYVLGVGAKMFIIAGPVLLYGTLASFLVGLIYFIATRWF